MAVIFGEEMTPPHSPTHTYHITDRPICEHTPAKTHKMYTHSNHSKKVLILGVSSTMDTFGPVDI